MALLACSASRLSGSDGLSSRVPGAVDVNTFVMRLMLIVDGMTSPVESYIGAVYAKIGT